MREEKAQSSMEFLLIFSVILMILIVFTLPLTEISLKNNLDSSNAISTKFEISKIADGINQIKSQGIGSKKTIILDLNQNTNVIVKENELIASFSLSNGENKEIKLKNNYNNVSSILNLNKGINTIVIYWNEGSNNIVVMKK